MGDVYGTASNIAFPYYLEAEAESKQRSILEAKLVFDAKNREQKIVEELRLAESERIRAKESKTVPRCLICASFYN